MDLPQEDIEKIKIENLLVRPTTKDELRDWIRVYLGLDLPDSHLDGEGSTSSPMEAVWESYNTFAQNKGDLYPGYVWLSARDAMKTLGASVLAVALLVFFDASICWLASIEPQSKIALNNVQSFIQKISSYLVANGKKVESNNARNLEIVSQDGKRSLVNILVATMASVNGRHVNIVMTDEIDLVRDPRVLDEVQAVASLIGVQFPLKVYFSTRKFAFGQMEKLIQKVPELGLTLLKWDILDVTEYCDIKRRLSDEKTETLFIHPDPPLRSVKKEEHDALPEVERKQYQEIKVFKGCTNCKLVSQCKTRLAERSPQDKGLLWKKIDHTINMFRSMSPDMATAQLLCRKPSLSGLVYPRFDELDNTLSISEAYTYLTGQDGTNATYDQLIDTMKANDIDFYVSGDWGSTACQAFVVSAVMPGGQWWILEAYAIPGLEFDDVLALGISIRDRFQPKKWFMDTNQPMFIKAFNKNGMSCKDFKKDVQGGIECVRAQVVDALGRRRLKVVKHDKNDIVIEMFRKHHFILDSLGNSTGEPDDGEAWSDVGDSIRYAGQNLFSIKGGKPKIAEPEPPKSKLVPSSADELRKEGNKINELRMKQEIFSRLGAEENLTSKEEVDAKGQKKKKGLIWSV